MVPFRFMPSYPSKKNREKQPVCTLSNFLEPSCLRWFKSAFTWGNVSFLPLSQPILSRLSWRPNRRGRRISSSGECRYSRLHDWTYRFLGTTLLPDFWVRSCFLLIYCFSLFLNGLIDLSTATVKRNSELEAKVAELEVELSVWKQAHSVALETSERETKAHNVQVAALNRQISNLDCFRVCCTFSQNIAPSSRALEPTSSNPLCYQRRGQYIFSFLFRSRTTGRKNGCPAAHKRNRRIPIKRRCSYIWTTIILGYSLF